MGPLGWQETVFIFVLALLIFGPKKLPELGKTIAKGIAEFRRASSELKATFDREMSNLERETESLKEVTQTYHNEISNYDSYYESSYYDSGHDSASNGAVSSDSTAANNSSTVSASATEGAESTANAAPANTVPSTSAAPNGDAAGAQETVVAAQPHAAEPLPDSAVTTDAKALPK
jgi:TatA/E family protein of Tat protein translocase